MKKCIVFIALAITLLSSSVFAATKAKTIASKRCYSPAEVQAEQLLRLHSELMVITVTCKVSSVGQDLVAAYTGFTKNNIDVLHDAEQTMVNYYKKAYGGKGIPLLDRLRTKLANEYGQQIANVSAPAFCAQRRDKVISMHGASASAVQGEVLKASASTYEPLCGSGMRTAQKSR